MLKKIFVPVFLVLAILCAIVLHYQQVQAAANGVVYDKTATFTEGQKGDTWVLYQGSCTTTAADCVGTHYTQALWIADYSQYNAYIKAVMSNVAGTEDCDVYVEYSFDRSSWFLGTNASGKVIDQVQTTAKYDTLNVATKVEDFAYRMGLWTRLKFAYQTGNPVGTTMSWQLKFQKDPNSDRRNAKAQNKI